MRRPWGNEEGLYSAARHPKHSTPAISSILLWQQNAAIPWGLIWDWRVSGVSRQIVDSVTPSYRIREPALVFWREFSRIIQAAGAYLEQMWDGRIEEHQQRPTIPAERSLAVCEADHFWMSLRPLDCAGMKKRPRHGMRAAGFSAVFTVAETGL